MFENYSFTPIGGDQYLYRDVQNTNLPFYIIQHSTAERIATLFLPDDSEITAILAENALEYTLKTDLISGEIVENTLLQIELGIAKNASQALESKVVALEGAHAADQSKIQELENAQAASKDELKDTQNELKDALGRLEILQQQIDKLLEINNLRSEKNDLREKNKKYAKANAELFLELEELKRRAAEHKGCKEEKAVFLSPPIPPKLPLPPAFLSPPIPPTIPQPSAVPLPQFVQPQPPAFQSVNAPQSAVNGYPGCSPQQDPQLLRHTASFSGRAPQNVWQPLAPTGELYSYGDAGPSYPQYQLPIINSTHVGGGLWARTTNQEGSSNRRRGYDGIRGTPPYVVGRKQER